MDVLNLEDLLRLAVQADLDEGVSEFVEWGCLALLELLDGLLKEGLRWCLS